VLRGQIHSEQEICAPTRAALWLLCWLFLALSASAADLRIGLIGCDTSHSVAFTTLINDPNDKHHVPGGKVVAAFKGGSPDIPSSINRVPEYSQKLEKTFGVKFFDSIPELCREVDVVLLESVDGRPHLEQVRPVLAAHKPVFIDKPVAGSLRDVLEIDRLARENKTPWFSSSAYRFYDSMVELKSANVGEIRGAISYGPCELEEHHPDFFWYGIHPVEALYTVMGPGCESVVRTTTTNADVATGVWSGGRVGTFRGVRGSTAAGSHAVTVFGSKAVAEQKRGADDYAPLVQGIMQFFQTGIAPVPNRETIEIYAFMEAADESKREGGKPVKISEVMKKNGVME
jgi:predicted dehydrogenase